MKISRTYYIYKLTNTITGQIYIGQTYSIYKRFHKYKTLQCKSQLLLYNCLKEYGWDNFKSEILQETNESKIDELETYYIKFYNSFYYTNKKIGLNMTSTGRASFRNLKHSKEAKLKISIGNKGKNSGKIHSKESNLKKSLNHSCKGKFGKDHHRSIPVYKYSLYGEYINSYNSMSDAARDNNCPPGNISFATKSKSHYYNGFIWGLEKLNFFLPDSSKVLYQYDLNGNFIKRWKGVSDIEKELGINKQHLSTAIRTNKDNIYKGFKWKKLKN